MPRQSFEPWLRRTAHSRAGSTVRPTTTFFRALVESSASRRARRRSADGGLRSARVRPPGDAVGNGCPARHLQSRSRLRRRARPRHSGGGLEKLWGQHEQLSEEAERGRSEILERFRGEVEALRAELETGARGREGWSRQPRQEGNLSVVSAEVEWDTHPGPRARLATLAVPSEFAHFLSPGPHVFLLAALISAGKHGETRVQLDEPISPLLAKGAADALGILSHWYGDPSVAIEAPYRASSPTPSPGRGAGLFLSGGVDSLASLQRNLELIPRDSAEAITHCINVDWLGPRTVDALEGRLRTSHERILKYLRRVHGRGGHDFVPVVTNLRSLENYDFTRDWIRGHGALLCAVAHALSGRNPAHPHHVDERLPHLRQWGYTGCSTPGSDPRSSWSPTTSSIAADSPSWRRLPNGAPHSTPSSSAPTG